MNQRSSAIPLLDFFRLSADPLLNFFEFNLFIYKILNRYRMNYFDKEVAVAGQFIDDLSARRRRFQMIE